MDTDDIVGEEIGCVSIHMYKETNSSLPLFRINTNSDNVLTTFLYHRRPSQILLD